MPPLSVSLRDRGRELLLMMWLTVMFSVSGPGLQTVAATSAQCIGTDKVVESRDELQGLSSKVNCNAGDTRCLEFVTRIKGGHFRYRAQCGIECPKTGAASNDSTECKACPPSTFCQTELDEIKKSLSSGAQECDMNSDSMKSPVSVSCPAGEKCAVAAWVDETSLKTRFYTGCQADCNAEIIRAIGSCGTCDICTHDCATKLTERLKFPKTAKSGKVYCIDAYGLESPDALMNANTWKVCPGTDQKCNEHVAADSSGGQFSYTAACGSSFNLCVPGHRTQCTQCDVSVTGACQPKLVELKAALKTSINCTRIASWNLWRSRDPMTVACPNGQTCAVGAWIAPGPTLHYAGCKSDCNREIQFYNGANASCTDCADEADCKNKLQHSLQSPQAIKTTKFCIFNSMNEFFESKADLLEPPEWTDCNWKCFEVVGKSGFQFKYRAVCSNKCPDYDDPETTECSECSSNDHPCQKKLMALRANLTATDASRKVTDCPMQHGQNSRTLTVACPSGQKCAALAWIGRRGSTVTYIGCKANCNHEVVSESSKAISSGQCIECESSESDCRSKIFNNIPKAAAGVRFCPITPAVLEAKSDLSNFMSWKKCNVSDDHCFEHVTTIASGQFKYSAKCGRDPKTNCKHDSAAQMKCVPCAITGNSSTCQTQLFAIRAALETATVCTRMSSQNASTNVTVACPIGQKCSVAAWIGSDMKTHYYMGCKADCTQLIQPYVKATDSCTECAGDPECIGELNRSIQVPMTMGSNRHCIDTDDKFVESKAELMALPKWRVCNLKCFEITAESGFQFKYKAVCANECPNVPAHTECNQCDFDSNQTCQRKLIALKADLAESDAARKVTDCPMQHGVASQTLTVACPNGQKCAVLAWIGRSGSTVTYIGCQTNCNSAVAIESAGAISDKCMECSSELDCKNNFFSQNPKAAAGVKFCPTTDGLLEAKSDLSAPMTWKICKHNEDHCFEFVTAVKDGQFKYKAHCGIDPANNCKNDAAAQTKCVPCEIQSTGGTCQTQLYGVQADVGKSTSCTRVATAHGNSIITVACPQYQSCGISPDAWIGSDGKAHYYHGCWADCTREMEGLGSQVKHCGWCYKEDCPRNLDFVLQNPKALTSQKYCMNAGNWVQGPEAMLSLNFWKACPSNSDGCIERLSDDHLKYQAICSSTGDECDSNYDHATRMRCRKCSIWGDNGGCQFELIIAKNSISYHLRANTSTECTRMSSEDTGQPSTISCPSLYGCAVASWTWPGNATRGFYMGCRKDCESFERSRSDRIFTPPCTACTSRLDCEREIEKAGTVTVKSETTSQATATTNQPPGTGADGSGLHQNDPLLTLVCLTLLGSRW